MYLKFKKLQKSTLLYKEIETKKFQNKHFVAHHFFYFSTYFHVDLTLFDETVACFVRYSFAHRGNLVAAINMSLMAENPFFYNSHSPCNFRVPFILTQHILCNAVLTCS